LDLLDRFSQLALVAARQALADSGLQLTLELKAQMAVITGSAMGGQSSQDETFVSLYRKNENRVRPLAIPRVMSNASASHISMDFGIVGPAYTVSTACASSTHAIGQAFWMVQNGQVETAISGGSESPFSFGILKAWEAMRVISPDTCRPFSKDRQGLILGEGAAMLVLEPFEAVLARGGKIYAEIVGFGMSSDAGHVTSPSVDGPSRAMNAALLNGAIQPEQVGYINAHGSGTRSNDATETRAIRQVFKKHADSLAISSTKAVHGHALGATGALEAVASVMALHTQTIPPTANFTAPDAECDLDVVPNHARHASCEIAISNSFAFGGLNGVLAFRKVV
jgi:nodulation protein E